VKAILQPLDSNGHTPWALQCSPFPVWSSVNDVWPIPNARNTETPRVVRWWGVPHLLCQMHPAFLSPSEDPHPQVTHRNYKYLPPASTFAKSWNATNPTSSMRATSLLTEIPQTPRRLGLWDTCRHHPCYLQLKNLCDNCITALNGNQSQCSLFNQCPRTHFQENVLLWRPPRRENLSTSCVNNNVGTQEACDSKVPRCLQRSTATL
jgi:hypothetical protein